MNIHRVALLLPQVSLEDAGLAEVASLHLWNQQLDVCMRVPGLSVCVPSEVGGQFSWRLPLASEVEHAQTKEFFRLHRREELVWAEVSLRGTGASVRLHSLKRSGERQSFDVLGADVGQALTGATEQWLASRGLGSLVTGFEEMKVAELVETLRVISGLVTAEQVRQALNAVAAVESATLYLVSDAASAEEDSDDDASDDEEASDDDSDESDSDDSDDDSDDDDDDSDDDDDDDDSDDDDSDSDDASDDESGDEDANDDESEDQSDAGPSPRPSPPTAGAREKLGARTSWASVRTLHSILGGKVGPLLEELDPTHPWSLWNRFEATQAHAPDFALLRECIDAAPGWDLPHGSVPIDEDELSEPETDEEQELRPTSLEQIASAGFAAFADPESHEVGCAYSNALSDEGRDDEALRHFRHRVADFGDDSSEHIELMLVHEKAERIGDWVHEARVAARYHGCPIVEDLPWYPDQILVDLGESDALMQAGRLEEGIQLRKNRIDGLRASWPRHTAILEKWKRSPRFVAWAYAREGYYRGEDARTVEGFGRVEPDDGIDLGMLLDALVATGREAEAPLAWAQFGEGRGFATPYSRLKGARALFAAGAWRTGLEQLLDVTVCSPRRGDEAERAHVARMLSGIPEEVVSEHLGALLEAGALTLARFVARDLADFWPGAAKHEGVLRALATGAAPPAVKVSWPGLTDEARARIDAWGADPVPTLEAADRLVNGWPELVFGGEEETARLAYLATTALERYLRRALGTPSVLSGAFRTIAAEAFGGLGRRQHELKSPLFTAILATLEPLWAAVDARLAGRWLAFVEQSLHLEEHAAGELDAWLAPFPATNARLTSPERLTLLSLEAAQLTRKKPEGWEAIAAPMLETLAWATGSTGVGQWARTSTDLDALLSAAWLERTFGSEASILAAHACFAKGDGETAFTTLCVGLQNAGEEYRDKQLEKLKKPFTAAKLGVPFDFKKASNVVFEALQKGDPARAERAARWCLAIDPENGEVSRNLGLALAAQGKIPEALTCLVKATREQATQILVGVLYQSGKLPEALRVLDFASRWYTRADQWLTYGGVVYAAMDNPRTVKGYATAYQLDPEAFDTSQLNGYAGVLDEVGDSKTCEQIAEHLIRAAGKDVMWLTNGWNHLACAYIGQGRFDEAVKWAKKAVEKNPLPDNTENFRKTLERASKKERYVAAPVVPTEPQRHAAYLLAETGDLAAVLALATSDDWNARRAALRAARFRYASDNHTPVTKTARDTASLALEQSTAHAGLAATICRSFALDLRAEGLDCAAERVPDLGDRLTRHAFYEEFRSRGGVIVGDAPDLGETFVDREVFPGRPFGSTAKYLALLADLSSRPIGEALAQHQLDHAGYLEVCTRWGKQLDDDPALRRSVAVGLR
jgi:tetratricopeptide (TPR) repeat protein